MIFDISYPKQKGGLLISLTEEEVRNFKNSVVMPMNCCPINLQMLGIIDEGVKQSMSHKFKNGLKIHELENSLNEIFEEHEFKVLRSIDISSLEEPFDYLDKVFFKNLYKNYAFILPFHRKDGSGHCVTGALDSNKKPTILDPQDIDEHKVGKIYSGEEEIKRWLDKENILFFYKIQSLRKEDSPDGSPFSKKGSPLILKLKEGDLRKLQYELDMLQIQMGNLKLSPKPTRENKRKRDD